MKQTLKYILQYIIETLKIAETKHSIIIALNSGVIVLALSLGKADTMLLKYLNYAVIFFAGLSIIISFYALHARSVRVKYRYKKHSDKNLLYYQNLASMSAGELLQNIILFYDYPKNYKIDNFDIDLASTIIANSKVIKLKFILFNRSTFFCTLSIVCVFAFFLISGAI